jgi:hypothetical protein
MEGQNNPLNGFHWSNTQTDKHKNSRSVNAAITDKCPANHAKHDTFYVPQDSISPKMLMTTSPALADKTQYTPANSAADHRATVYSDRRQYAARRQISSNNPCPDP